MKKWKIWLIYKVANQFSWFDLILVSEFHLQKGLKTKSQRGPAGLKQRRKFISLLIYSLHPQLLYRPKNTHTNWMTQKKPRRFFLRTIRNRPWTATWSIPGCEGIDESHLHLPAKLSGGFLFSSFFYFLFFCFIFFLFLSSCVCLTGSGW